MLEPVDDVNLSRQKFIQVVRLDVSLGDDLDGYLVAAMLFGCGQMHQAVGTSAERTQDAVSVSFEHSRSSILRVTILVNSLGLSSGSRTHRQPAYTVGPSAAIELNAKILVKC